MYRFVMLLLMVAIVAGCNNKKSGPSGAEAKLLRLNSLYDSAILKRDMEALKTIYATDFIYTNPEGRLLNKMEQITSLGVSEIKLEEGKSTDVKVTVYDDMAVMTGTFQAKGSYRGNPITINERYTSTWIKTDTSWQLVAAQANVLK